MEVFFFLYTEDNFFWSFYYWIDFSMSIQKSKVKKKTNNNTSNTDNMMLQEHILPQQE